MSCYEIVGGRPLSGSLAVQGAKNSALPLLAAALLAPGESIIHNCPRLSDVSVALEILEGLGCRVHREGDVVAVDAAVLSKDVIPENLMREMRASVLFLGALLARAGSATLFYPGGCDLGSRPIDLHLDALRALGAEIAEEQGNLFCRGGRAMVGRELYLPLPSVGATENIMLAACGCAGTTTIVGAAREPEIVDLQNFLRAMGARVWGAGTSVILVEGGHPLHAAEYTVMGDRIAAATWLCAVGAAGGTVELTGVSPKTLTALLFCLEEAGCRVHTGPQHIRLTGNGKPEGIRPVHTGPFPGFPTDGQAILMAALAGGTGTTVFVENVFDSRYRHVDELRRMGAQIRVSGRVAVVTGGGRLQGAAVRGTDLRGAAALAVAGVAAEGTTRLTGLHHLERGYEDFTRALTGLGAEIKQVP